MAATADDSTGTAPDKRNLYNSGAIVALSSFASKGIGYLREVLLAYFFGTGAVVDAFRIALTAVLLPVNILAGGGLQNSFIPVFRGFLSKNRRRVAWVFANQLFFILIVAGLAIFLLEYFFADRWIFILAPGFNPEQTRYAVFFTRIMSFSVPLMMACSIAFVLNCFYIFRMPSLKPVIQNVFVLGGILLTVYRGRFEFMGAAFPAAYVIFFIMLAASARKFWQFRLTSSLKRTMKIWAEFMPVWLPLFGMVLVGQLNIYIDRVITSLLSEGSVSALEYSRFLVETPGTTIGLGFMSVFLPYFSDLWAKNDVEELNRNIERMLLASVYIMLPLSLVLFVSSGEIIKLIFGYGKFGSASVSLTAGALRGYSLGVWAYFLYIPVSKYYQAVRRNGLLLVCFAVSLAVNIVLNLLFYRPFGIQGIAVATSISQVILFILLFSFMSIPGKAKTAGKIVYMVAVAVAAGAAAWTVRRAVKAPLPGLGAVIASAALLWFVLNLAIRDVRDKAAEIIRNLRSRRGR